MSLDHTSYNAIEIISPILDEYTKWYGAAIIGILKGNVTPISNPAGSVLKNFLTTLSNDHFITNIRAEQLLNLQKNMQSHYEKSLQTGIESFFKDSYECFFAQIRALERDCVLESSGFDYVTGLRSKSVLLADISKELEHLSRNGNSFSIALVQIDHYSEIDAYSTDMLSLQYNQKVGNLIQDCIRNFDIAYRSGLGEFVIILKQSDISGGLSAISRMHKVLEDEKYIIEIDGQNILLSLSTCVAVPVEHDLAEDLIKNLRADLKNGKGDKGDGSILQYHEISPVQRYLQEDKGL